VSCAQLSGFRLDGAHLARWVDRMTTLPGFRTTFELLPMTDANITA
jgi:hypothetical protein